MSAAGKALLRVERLVDVRIGPFVLGASPSQVGATCNLVEEAMRRAARPSAPPQADMQGGASSSSASPAPMPSSASAAVGSSGGSSSSVSLFSPRATTILCGGASSSSATPPTNASMPTDAPGAGASSSSSSAPAGVTAGVTAGGGGGGSGSSSEWLSVAQVGKLRARSDLSHWTKQFQRGLVTLYKHALEGQRGPLAKSNIIVRTEGRVALEPITLRLRAEGSRGSYSAPLVELRCSHFTMELNLQQRRSTRSSVPSLYQLWDVDRLHSKVHTSSSYPPLTHSFSRTHSSYPLLPPPSLSPPIPLLTQGPCPCPCVMTRHRLPSQSSVRLSTPSSQRSSRSSSLGASRRPLTRPMECVTPPSPFTPPSFMSTFPRAW